MRPGASKLQRRASFWMPGHSLGEGAQPATEPGGSKAQLALQGEALRLSPAPRGAGKDLAGPGLGPGSASSSCLWGAGPCVSAETRRPRGRGREGRCCGEARASQTHRPAGACLDPEALHRKRVEVPALGEAFASPFPQPPVCQEGSHRGSLNICPKEPEMPERANGGCTGWGAAGCQPGGCFPPSHHSCAPAKPPRPLASRDSCQLRPRASLSGRWSPPHFAEGRQQTTQIGRAHV